jgi:phosphatidylserine/phosphatidylglycerophosphate/cardiolipin synthase-like enzyme
VKTDTLLVVNENYLPVLLKLLDHAEKSIDIIAFSFAIGSAGGKLAPTTAPFEVAEKLVELKERLGKTLTIRLYIEGHRETTDRNRVTAEYLKKAGIKVKYGSTHAKGFCIDDRYVLFGSTNLTHQSMLKNNETNLFFDNADVAAGFRTYFTHLWNGGRHGQITLPPPLIADGAFKDALLQLMDRAKKRLEFSIYFFHHTELQEGLIRAHDRGVKVTGFVHDHAAFAMSYVRRTRGTVQRLRDAGISDLHFGPRHLFTHSKFLIRDRAELVLGTGNWLHEDIKVHPQLYVRLDNRALATELAEHLAAQIANA